MNHVVDDRNKFLEKLTIKDKVFYIHSLPKAENYFKTDFSSLPYSIQLIIESQLRLYNHGQINLPELEQVITSILNNEENTAVSYYPTRVVIQDYTGVPVLVDLATLRDTVEDMGGDARTVNPVVQTDIVIDHSIQVDVSNNEKSLEFNTDIEYNRNLERYKLLRWGEENLENVRIFPSGSGIIHQINLEFLATLVRKDPHNKNILIPDSVIGTDSHTTMINALGILGWGVGGIEAESVMLGQSLKISVPPVVGVKLIGDLNPGITTTDLVLTITKELRRVGVVNHFVEFFGEGVDSLKLAERATISNMAPEFGATCAYFPIDQETIEYLKQTGREEELVHQVYHYYNVQGLLKQENHPQKKYDKEIEINLQDIVPSLAGPKRPQDRVPVPELKTSFNEYLKESNSLTVKDSNVDNNSITNGSILIAAITSCTNTSNPTVMVAAGLLARNAYKMGLTIPSYVKTSFSPGSKVVSDYLSKAGLTPYLDYLGFHVVGYGCMTCSGSSGPLNQKLENTVKDKNLTVASVLSGNRNFEGRIHPLIKANYLASPPLVIAYAIAGKVDINLDKEAIGFTDTGIPVYLKDIWPSKEEIDNTIGEFVTPSLYKDRYDEKSLHDYRWKGISQQQQVLYNWDETSTYIKKPNYFSVESNKNALNITAARALAILGDSITTDHISPGGRIGLETPAGKYLSKHGVEYKDFNTFGSRRGNHEVIKRGTFGNVRLKNKMAPGLEGGFTMHQPSQEIMSIYSAAMNYETENTPLLILAGKEYGSGSSRDSAAKGTASLGVRAVIAESFERIHRSNLINMGVLPLTFANNENVESLYLDGSEKFNFVIPTKLNSEIPIEVTAVKTDGTQLVFNVFPQVDTKEEEQSFFDGGILHSVLKKLLLENKPQVWN